MADAPVPPPAPDSSRSAMAERAISMVRSLSLQNLLTMALLAMIAIPSWFAWKFMQDTAFRREFLATTRVVDMKVPCLVVMANVNGRNDQYTIYVSYDFKNRFEYMIAVQSPGLLADNEVQEVCDKVHVEAALMRASVREREMRTQDGK